MADGQVDQAITEYRRFIYFRQVDAPALAGHAAGQIALAFRQIGRLEVAIAMHHVALEHAGTSEAKGRLRIELALTEMLRERYDLADFVLLRVETVGDSSALSARAAFLLGVSSLYQSKWSEAWDAFGRYSASPAAEPDVVEILQRLRLQPLRVKSESKARKLSTFIPGLGQVYAGKVRSGVGAFMLTGAGALLVVRDALTGRWWDSVSDFSGVFLKFYRGNRNGAARAAAAVNAAAGRQMVAELMRALERPPS